MAPYRNVPLRVLADELEELAPRLCDCGRAPHTTICTAPRLVASMRDHARSVHFALKLLRAVQGHLEHELGSLQEVPDIDGWDDAIGPDARAVRNIRAAVLLLDHDGGSAPPAAPQQD